MSEGFHSGQQYSSRQVTWTCVSIETLERTAEVTKGPGPCIPNHSSATYGALFMSPKIQIKCSDTIKVLLK